MSRRPPAGCAHAVETHNFCFGHGQNREPEGALATLTLGASPEPALRDPMTSFLSPELLWLATAFIMLMAAFLAAAAE